MIFIKGKFEKEILSDYIKDGVARIKRVFVIVDDNGWKDYVQVFEDTLTPKVGDNVELPLLISGYVKKVKAKIFYSQLGSKK